METTRQNNRTALFLFLGVLLVYLAVLAPSNYSIDGNSMTAVAESVVARGALSVPAPLGTRGPDGLFYSNWYPLFSLIALPFVAAARVTAPLLGLPPHYLAVAAVLLMQAVISALCVMLVFLLARRLNAEVRPALLSACGYAFGSVAWVYSRNLYADPLLALVAITAAFAAVDEKQRPFLLFLLSMAAMLAKPAGIIIGPSVALYLFMKHRRFSAALWPVAGMLAGFLLCCAYNYVRFGSLFAFGSPWVFSFSAILLRSAGLLFSPGRGLLIYCPLLLAGLYGWVLLFRQKPLEVLFISLLCGGHFFIHSLWTIWEGGWSWGPRLLLPMIPLLCAGCAFVLAKRRKIFFLLVVLGFLVNLPPLFFTYERYYIESHDRGISARALVWSARHAPFIFAWQSVRHQWSDARGQDLKQLVRGAGTDDRYGESFRILPYWWWMVPSAGIPLLAGILGACLLFVSGVRMLHKSFSIVRKEP